MQFAILVPILFCIVAAGSDVTTPGYSSQVVPSSSTHTVLVGGGSSPFQPNHTSLPIGDTLRFVFMKDDGILIQSSLQEPCEPNGAFQASADEGQVDVLVSGTEPQWFFYSAATQGCSPDALFGLNVRSKGQSSTSQGAFPTLDAHGIGISFGPTQGIGTMARWTGSMGKELGTCTSTLVTVTQTVTVFTVVETVSIIDILEYTSVPDSPQTSTPSRNLLSSSFSYQPTRPVLKPTNPGTVGSQASLGLFQATNGSWSWPAPAAPSKQLLHTASPVQNAALAQLPSSTWFFHSLLIVLLVRDG